MARKDSSKAGTGGVRPAGAGISAASGRRRDAAALPVVRNNEGRPPCFGPQRGGVPKRIHLLKGMIAPNYVSTDIFLKSDLLGLLDPANWRHPHAPQNWRDLREATLCAMFACCGATTCEAKPGDRVPVGKGRNGKR